MAVLKEEWDADHVGPTAKPFTKLLSNKIIVAEDDLGDQELLWITLKEWISKEKIKFVKNGDELMDYLNVRGKFARSRYPRKGGDKPPSLIILDLNMPGKDGIEALREIRNDRRFRSVPVIVLTGTTDDREIEQVFKLGANAFLSKPFDQKEMAMALMHGFNFSAQL